MMHDDGIHEIDMPHIDAADDATLETPAPATATVPANAETSASAPSSTSATGVARSVRALAALRTSKRLRIFSVAFAIVGALALGLALASHSVLDDSSSSSSSAAPSLLRTASSTTGSLISVATMDTKPSRASQLPLAPSIDAFLRLQFANDHKSQFVLSKTHWNSSFLVYPTIEKHSGPPHAGTERGTILLDTTDYVFHFERSLDGASLLFVPENHRVRLASHHASNDSGLAAVFDTSHWPGYYLKLPITLETDDAIYVDADPFLSTGFFVADVLVTTLYDIHASATKVYPRNTLLCVEYVLETGIAVVSYAIGLLPETVMPQRVADDRVGYFSSRYTLYNADSRSASVSSDGFHYMDPAMVVLNRRRLELDPETNRTKEPIVYYIDPSVPKRWRRAFVAGVEAWKPAFDAIGFPDALRAVEPDDDDWPSDYHLGDLRYDSISVMISDETYALGPSVIDPRSGEILHSDILFEYGFINDVVADFEQRAPVEPPSPQTHASASKRAAQRYGRLRQCGLAQHDYHRIDRMLLGMVAGSSRPGDDDDALPYVSDDLIGQHFTDIVMHEVGHTLGLRHNFAGSSRVSRKELSDDAFVAKHGLSTSIMDYVPVNIFSDLTPKKAKTHRYYMTTIGAYDMAAIAYGYAIVPDEVPGLKCAGLTELARSAPFFLTDEDVDATASPFGQRFDLTNDPVDFAADRLELAKQLRATSVLRKIPDDASWTVLWRREAALLRMINHSVDALVPMLGGVNVSHAHRSQNESKYAPLAVPRAQQLRALSVLTRIISGEQGLFPAPADYSSYIKVRGSDWEDCTEPSLEYGCLARGLVDVDSAILSIQRSAISSTLEAAMARIVAQDVAAPVTVAELLASLRTATSTATPSGKSDSGSTAASTVGTHAKVLRAFLVDTLQRVVDSDDADVRITDAITSVFPSIESSRAGSDSAA